MSDIFSTEALDAQLQKLDQLPPEEAGVGAVKQGRDVGVTAAGSKALGKGWALKGSVTWMKDAGYSAAAWLGWRKKQD